MSDGNALVRATWDKQAAELSEEFGFEIHWCPLGFEVPGPDGIMHVTNQTAARTILGGTQ
jgi:hypothetical protein